MFVIGCFTLSGLKADIVKLMNVSQHKGGWVSNCVLRMDYYFTIKAADNTDGSLKVVCCSKQNHMVTPGTVFCHAL